MTVINYCYRSASPSFPATLPLSVSVQIHSCCFFSLTPLPSHTPLASMQIHGTCLGFQLLHILASNVSRNVLLVDTDSVSHAATLDWAPGAEKSHMFKNMDVSDQGPAWKCLVLTFYVSNETGQRDARQMHLSRQPTRV